MKVFEDEGYPIGDLHVFPSHCEEHEVSERCFCVPILTYQDPRTKRKVWVHRDKSNSN